MVTEDIVIGTEWVDLEVYEDAMVIHKINGSDVRYRFGSEDESTSVGALLTAPIIVDNNIQVKAESRSATIAVSR